MRRREFLAAALVPIAPIAGLKVPIAGLPPSRFALRRTGKSRATPSPRHAGGSATATRTFEITARVELDAAGPARAWIPLPLTRETAYQRDGGHTIGGNASRTQVQKVDGASMVAAEWRGGVSRVRETLFGSWEMNWIAYNDAHDVALPGGAGKPLPFFMYPQAEVAGVRRDSLDPERFRYTITAKELPA